MPATGNSLGSGTGAAGPGFSPVISVKKITVKYV